MANVRLSVCLGPFLIFMSGPVSAATCDSLAALRLLNVTIKASQIVERGAFSLPGTDQTAPVLAIYKALPPFCRVQGVVKPTSDSHIEFEVWLPLENWNGSFQAVGNGGWGGSINYVGRDSAVDRDLASAIQKGYATASTDTGHRGSGAAFAQGHPEKLIDFAYRAVHETAVQSKSIIAAFYGQVPRYSYWNGCSAGGGQGVMEAWRYPNDFDGILAGAAGNPLNMNVDYWWIWVAQAVHRTPDSFIPASKYALLHDAAMNACDSVDGLKDGLITDPTVCHFDPKILECKGADALDCLTHGQVEAARQIYSPARDPLTQKAIYPGLEPGSELGWATLAGETAPPFATEFFRYLIFKDPAWDFRSLRFDSRSKLPNTIPASFNPMNPNLKGYFERKGKLLLFHGWSDQIGAPRGSVEFYQSVLKAVGTSSKATDSIRLFMAPGMAHCGGGDGPNKFDGLRVLETWVEKGNAPTSIVASHSTKGEVDRTRPLCAYPQVARYRGSGSINEAANFVCRIP